MGTGTLHRLITKVDVRRHLKINMIKINLSPPGAGRQERRRCEVVGCGFANMINYKRRITNYLAIFGLKEGARTGHVRRMSSLSHLRQAVAPEGTLVIVGSEVRGRLLGGFDRNLRAVALSLLVSQRLRMLGSQPQQQDLQALRELIQTGKVTAVIDKTFPLSQVPQAIRYLVEAARAAARSLSRCKPRVPRVTARSLPNCFHRRSPAAGHPQVWCLTLHSGTPGPPIHTTGAPRRTAPTSTGAYVSRPSRRCTGPRTQTPAGD
jgi:hypothetical protein